MASTNSVQSAPQELESPSTMTNRVAGNILRVSNLIRVKGDLPEAHDDIILPVKTILEELALLYRDPTAWAILALLHKYMKEFGNALARFSNEETWAVLSPSIHFLLSAMPSISHVEATAALCGLILEIAQNPAFLSWALEEDLNLIGLMNGPCLADPLNPDPEFMRTNLCKLGLELLSTLLTNTIYTSKVLLSQSQLLKSLKVIGFLKQPGKLFFNLLPRIAAFSQKSQTLSVLTTWLLPLVADCTLEGLLIIRAVIKSLLSGPGLPPTDLELAAGLCQFLFKVDPYSNIDAVQVSIESLALLCADKEVPPLLGLLKIYPKIAELVRSPLELSDRAVLAVVAMTLSADKQIQVPIAEGIASRASSGAIMREAKMILVSDANLPVDLQRKLQSSLKDESLAKIKGDEYDDGAVVEASKDSKGNDEEYQFQPFKLVNRDYSGLGLFPIGTDPLKLFDNLSNPFKQDYQLETVADRTTPPITKIGKQLRIDPQDTLSSNSMHYENRKTESAKSKTSSSVIGPSSPHIDKGLTLKSSKASLAPAIQNSKYASTASVKSAAQLSKSYNPLKPTASPIVEITEQPPRDPSPSFADPAPRKPDQTPPQLDSPQPEPLVSPKLHRAEHSLPQAYAGSTDEIPFTHRQSSPSPKVTFVPPKQNRGSSWTDSDREREELEQRLSNLEKNFNQTLVMLGETAKQE